MSNPLPPSLLLNPFWHEKQEENVLTCGDSRYVWNERKQFGQLVGEFQGMQHQIAQSYTEITAARHLVYNAARKKEAGEEFIRDAAMAKLYASQVAGRVSGLAVEWMGGMGFVREGLAEKFFRDSKIGAIYEGTSNIQ